MENITTINGMTETEFQKSELNQLEQNGAGYAVAKIKEGARHQFFFVKDPRSEKANAVLWLGIGPQRGTRAAIFKKTRVLVLVDEGIWETWEFQDKPLIYMK
jgi:hypothetical protein